MASVCDGNSRSGLFINFQDLKAQFIKNLKPLVEIFTNHVFLFFFSTFNVVLRAQVCKLTITNPFGTVHVEQEKSIHLLTLNPSEGECYGEY